MTHTCLNCKHEPIWSGWTKGAHPYQSGRCQWDLMQIPPLPRCCHINRQPIMRYKDDSGVMTNCRTWEPKE